MLVLAPYESEGHSEAEETVSDDCEVPEPGFFTERTEPMLGKTVHILSCRPGFSDKQEEAIEGSLRKEYVQQGNSRVRFYREISVRRG